MTNEDAIKHLNTILEIANSNDCCNVEIDAFYEEAIELAINILKEKQELTGKEYLGKLPKETLVEATCIRWCPYDFGFHTEYSSDKKNCHDIHQGDCEECWNSKVIDKKIYMDNINERLIKPILFQIERDE